MKPIKTLFIFAILLIAFCPLFTQTQPEPPSNFDEPNAGTEENPYLISTFANLKWLTIPPINWSKHFLQTEDIDASETAISYQHRIGTIGLPDREISMEAPFAGVYDGGNNAILNLYNNDNGAQWFGDARQLTLFGFTRGATIKNLKLENINYIATGFSSVGGLITESVNTNVINCSVSGNILRSVPFIVGSFGAGGLIQSAVNTLVENCSSSVSLVGLSNVSYLGGLVGVIREESVIKNSFFYGSINREQEHLGSGGLVGSAWESTIENCYVSGVSEFENFTAIIGSISNTTIKNTFWDYESTGVQLLFNTDINEDSVIINSFGLTTTEMKQASTYIDYGWDFDTIWAINSSFNDGYPFLRSLYPEVPHVNERDITIIPLNYSFVYPNPVKDSDVSFKTNLRNQSLQINIYNIRGQLVKKSDDFQTRGEETVFVWNRRDMNNQEVASGVYFYRIFETSNNVTQHGKFLIIK